MYSDLNNFFLIYIKIWVKIDICVNFAPPCTWHIYVYGIHILYTHYTTKYTLFHLTASLEQ